MAHIMSDLPSEALKIYRQGKKRDELDYFPSDAFKEDNELQTEIRICESLSEKPGKDDKDDEGDDGDDDEKKDDKPDDVFDKSNWGNQLLVKRFSSIDGERFGFILNMFAVVPMHSLIATEHFEKQIQSLTRAQLYATYSVLQSMASIPVYEQDGKTRTGGGKFVSFFNCGSKSGASQPHKHIQFLPLEGQDGLGDFPTERGARAVKLSDDEASKPFSISALPYVHFVRRLSLPQEQDQLADYLHSAYKSLVDIMVETLKDHPDCETTQLDVEDGLSYNLLMTHEHMHIVPREVTDFHLPPDPQEENGKDGHAATTEPVQLSVNGIAYCGTVLVESSKDDMKLRKLGGVIKVLTESGFKKQ